MTTKTTKNEAHHIRALHTAVAAVLPDFPDFMSDYEHRFAVFYQKMKKFHEVYMEALYAEP